MEKKDVADAFDLLQELLMDDRHDDAKAVLQHIWPHVTEEIKDESCARVTLGVAATTGDLDIVRHLVEAGVSINATGSLRKTPAQCAVNRDNLEVLQYLAEKGADLNAREPMMGMNVLLQAIMGGRTNCALYLIDRGVPCDDSVKTIHMGRYGYASVDIAASRGNVPVYFKLLERGVLARRKTTPLEHAVMSKNVDVVKACLEHEEYGALMQDDAFAQKLIGSCTDEEVRPVLQATQARLKMASIIGSDRGPAM